MESINEIKEKLNQNILSKHITYNIINNKKKNLFFFFIVDQNYKDKIEISFKNKNDIINPNSLIIKSYDFTEKKFIFKSNLKRYLFFMN